MTYSIVARDAATGQLGVAAQSCYFALGSALPWARAGVGAVATQSQIDPGYGPRCLDLLAGGANASDALEKVRYADKGREDRQVGVVGADGSVASFTGSMCIDEVSHAAGDGYSAQANMMAGPGVCEAMAEAFESTPGALATRLVASLLAAEAMGGDARGQLSATLMVVEGAPHDHPWEGVLVDVRVDHHHDPLVELSRLVQIAEAYELCDAAWEALEAGDAAEAVAKSEAPLAWLPNEGNLLLVRIGALVGAGRVDEAAAEVRHLVSGRPGWAGVLQAFVQRGLIPWPDDLAIESMLG